MMQWLPKSFVKKDGNDLSVECQRCYSKQCLNMSGRSWWLEERLEFSAFWRTSFDVLPRGSVGEADASSELGGTT